MDIIYKVRKYLKKHPVLAGNILSGTLVVLLLICVGINIACVNTFTEEKLTMGASSESLKNQNEELIKKVSEQDAKLKEQSEIIDELNNQITALHEENKELLKNAACNAVSPDPNYLQSKYIWNYLTTDMGLNKYVAAGIMGNIMTEVGGQTLDISKYSCRESNGGMYYGICQWAGARKSRLLNDFGGSLEAQCKFLCTELLEVIPKGNSFYDLQNEKEAALYFAKHFERCATWSYGSRQTNATTALKYFTDNDR